MGDMAEAFGVYNRSAEASNSVSLNRYAVRWQWVGIYVLSVSVMAIAALAGLVLGWKTRGPDILGYCSTMLVNSPYIKQGRGIGSTMGGVERARVFGKTPLKLVDIDADKDIGYITLVEDDASVRPGSLQRRRYYK